MFLSRVLKKRRKMVKLGYQVIKLSLFSFQVEMILLCYSILFNWCSGSTVLKRMQFRHKDWAISNEMEKWHLQHPWSRGLFRRCTPQNGNPAGCFQIFTETFRFEAQERGDNVIKRFCPVAPSLSEWPWQSTLMPWSSLTGKASNKAFCSCFQLRWEKCTYLPTCIHAWMNECMRKGRSSSEHSKMIHPHLSRTCSNPPPIVEL